MNQLIRILIVDDHTLVREALGRLLALDPGVEVVGQASTGREALELIPARHPSVVLLDLSLPGLHGIDVIREIKSRYSAVKCLVLTVYSSDHIVQAALLAGAWGYLLKEASYDELMIAIHAVGNGQRYISPSIADKVVSGLSLSPPGQTEGLANPWQRLSDRERQVLKFVAEGMSNKEIADNLCLSVRTVEKHRASLMAKLNLKTVAALTAFAIKCQLVTDTDVLKRDPGSKGFV